MLYRPNTRHFPAAILKRFVAEQPHVLYGRSRSTASSQHFPEVDALTPLVTARSINEIGCEFGLPDRHFLGMRFLALLVYMQSIANS